MLCKFETSIVATGLLLTFTAASAEPPVTVNVENFIRAETDQYLARYAAQGGFGEFVHVREPVQIDQQDVIRMNRDTFGT